MLKFSKEQRIFEIGGVKVGGQPGELPTVLIGSIFHKGHKIVKDRKQGIFDKRRAKSLILAQKEFSLKTGNPRMLDVVGENSEALKKYIQFVSELDDCPILINGPNFNVRISSIKFAFEIGLEERVIYNSINYTFSEREAEALKDLGVKAALIQAFNPKNPRPKGMVSIIKELLKAAMDAGVDRALLLTPILDVPSIGLGAEGLWMIKNEVGLPTGTVPLGVIGKWKRSTEFGEVSKKMFWAGALALSQAMGADFIIYGSVAKARYVFPLCAMVDAVIAYNARMSGLKPLTRNHPLYKIL